jgi:hypothetical protein
MDHVRATLRDLVVQHGAEAMVDDPRRCRALLTDLCPEHPREVSVLAAAVEVDIPRRLLADGTRLGVGPLAARLEQARGLAPEAAHWAVETWAHALGVPGSAPRATSPPPAQPPAKPTPREPQPDEPGQRRDEFVVHAVSPQSREWPTLSYLNGIFLLLCLWAVVIGIGGLVSSTELLCRLEFTGRPPFLWIRVVTGTFAFAGESCQVLGGKVLLGAAGGIGLGLGAWRNEWF